MKQLRFLDLEEVKQHLRIDGNDEDKVITRYCLSAETEALRTMQRTLESLYEEFGEVPDDIIEACMMRIATHYKYREDLTDRNLWRVDYAWDRALIPYIPPKKL